MGGGVIRDNRGNWVVSFSIKINVLNATQAEILAVYYGLRLAITMDLTAIEIASDSMDTITLIKGETVELKK